jgi:chloramphenicol 3-O-phosphotransferase
VDPEHVVDAGRRLMTFPVRLVGGLMRVNEFLRVRLDQASRGGTLRR